MRRYAFAYPPLQLKCSDLLVLPGSPTVASTALPEAFTTGSVTKAMPI